MREQPRRGMNLGTSTLFVVFTVLCLTVFSLLALASAQSDARLTERAAEQARRYYEADARAEEFRREAAELLQAGAERGDTAAQLRETLLAAFGDGFDAGQDELSFAAAVSDEVRLTVRLQVLYQPRPACRVLDWRTEQVRELPMDETREVWIPGAE